MSQKDRLFTLVKSLNRNEKGYFRRQIRGHRRNEKAAYEQLFDAIDAMERYDEKKLLKKFAGQPLTRQFAVAKNYLYNALLDSLESYHRSNSSTVFSLLNRSDILLARGLYTQAAELSEAAIGAAEATENFALQLIALRQHHIAVGRSDLARAAVMMDAMEKHIGHTMHRLENYYAHWLHFSRIYFFSLQLGQTKQDARIAQFDAQFGAFTERHPEGPLSQTASAEWNKALAAWGFSAHDYERQYEANKALAVLYAANEKLFPRSFAGRLNFTANLCSCCLALHRFDEAADHIREMEALEPRNEAELLQQEMLLYNLRFNLVIGSGGFSGVMETLRPFAAWFAEKGAQADPVLGTLLPLQASYLAFGAGQHHEALRWFNRAISRPGTGLRDDMQSTQRILELLIHFELGNFDLLEYRLKSAYRYFARKKKLLQVERIVLDHLRGLLVAGPGKETDTLLISLRDALEEIDHQKENGPDQLDLLSWAESRLTGRPFAEIAAEKAKNAAARRLSGERGC